MGDDVLIDTAERVLNKLARDKYTVRITGYVPVYRFVREDEEQVFDAYLDPFLDELNAAFSVGDCDEDAVRAVVGYADEERVREEREGATDSEA